MAYNATNLKQKLTDEMDKYFYFANGVWRLNIDKLTEVVSEIETEAYDDGYDEGWNVGCDFGRGTYEL